VNRALATRLHVESLPSESVGVQKGVEISGSQYLKFIFGEIPNPFYESVIHFQESVIHFQEFVIHFQEFEFFSYNGLRIPYNGLPIFTSP